MWIVHYMDAKQGLWEGDIEASEMWVWSRIEKTKWIATGSTEVLISVTEINKENRF